jgi:allophanate hydrolase
VDLHFDIGSLRAAYAAGVTAEEVVGIALARLAAAEDPGIFIAVAGREELLRQAQALGAFDPERPLWGIPCAVKDNIDVAGMPTTAACPQFAYVPAEDATCVALLRAAGAIVIGKTNLDQFATGLVGLRTPYPVPRNPIDPALVPGGSSSGSAVAVARGIVAFALGTDTAGSGRVPAGLNNIVGLKPTRGIVSAHGVVPACRSLDCVSIFALTVADATRVLGVVARPDARDPYARAIPSVDRGFGADPLRIGVPTQATRRFFGDEAMRVGYEAALARLAELGHGIVEIPFDGFYEVADLLYEGAWVAERYAAIRDFMDTREEALHPVTRAIIGGARKLSAVDAFEGFYRLRELQARLAPVIAGVDAIAVPTAPMLATVAAVEREPVAANARLGTYTNFVNLLDLCGIAVPCGHLAGGWPMSITLLGPAGRDASIAALGAALHEACGNTLGATGWKQPSASTPIEAPAGDGIDFAVVGAHMSGMALNGELRALGGRLVRAARTATGYRLFALAGTRPARPGLIRDAAGGCHIEIEIWRLSPEAFGRFVAAIPAPLCMGTVQLEDGTSCKGFLVEEAGLEGALDVSRFGGWRHYLAQAKVEA